MLSFQIRQSPSAMRESRVFITKKACCHYGECYNESDGFSSFIVLLFCLGVFRGSATESMVMEDTPEAIKFSS